MYTSKTRASVINTLFCTFTFCDMYLAPKMIQLMMNRMCAYFCLNLLIDKIWY